MSLVPTPIGNLEDVTLRALRVLREADMIACEDTRTSSVFLRRYGISAPLVSFHLHNEKERLPQLLQALREGKNVAVISDAGTPGISDPGFLLLQAALEEGLEADALPGPSALLPALLLSGLPPHPFFFYGFPPEKPGVRKALFASLADAPWTLVFYVSPHKAERQVSEMREIFGDRRAALVREISKVYQEAIRGTLSDILSRLALGVKGEMVLLVAGRLEDPEDEDWRLFADELLAQGMRGRTVVEEVMAHCCASRNSVKDYVMKR